MALKCEGLSDEYPRRQSMPPSTLSLLGLVRRADGDARGGLPGWQAESLDVTGVQPRGTELVSLRLVMLHRTHGYARHNGHADLLREGIDGTVGA